MNISSTSYNVKFFLAVLLFTHTEYLEEASKLSKNFKARNPIADNLIFY